MKTINGLFLAVLSLALVALPATAQEKTATDAAARVSVTTQGLKIERGAESAESSIDAYDVLSQEGARDSKTSAIEQREAAGRQALAVNTDFWIYDAFVTLFADTDRDGYFSGIELTFDADTIFTAADVYAVVYLSFEYGPWNEYAVTNDFTIFGTSATDEYVIETELVSGYPTGDYDILIELYDTFDGYLVASFGPEDSPELSLLPLEDFTYDAPVGTTTQVVVNSGGGGSASWLLILALAGAAGLARRHRIS